MWLCHWCREINELHKKIHFGLTRFVLLFAQAMSKIYPHAPPLIKHLMLRNVITLGQGLPTFCLPCTPSAFQQISMYPFSISTDEHVPLKSRKTKYFIITIHRCN